jgi:hypothetical protein
MTPQNKALSWIILVLNEDNVLYYCLCQIFDNDAFTEYYNEESYLFTHRE